jgi:hypothetical protein
MAQNCARCGTEIDDESGFCLHCRRCELCGLNLDRPLTADQLAMVVSCSPRPDDAPNNTGNRLCLFCRALIDTQRQQRLATLYSAADLPTDDKEIGAKIRALAQSWIDKLTDEEIGQLARMVAVGDLVGMTKEVVRMMVGRR